MRLRKRTVFTLAGLLLILSIPAYIVWVAMLPHRTDPGTNSSPADVADCTLVPPPPEATNIRVARYSAGQWRCTFVRFTAPVTVCQAYAAAVMPKTPLIPVTENQEYQDAMNVCANVNNLSDLRWFDLSSTRQFWSTAAAPVYNKPDSQKLVPSPQILAADEDWSRTQGYLCSGVRVDTARGVFYFVQAN